MVKNHPTHLLYDFEAEEDQLVVFSEMYYPKGWTVKIDGEEADFFPVNYVLRGLMVPMGSHRIEISFDPPVVRLGSQIRLISLMFFLLILGYFGYVYFRLNSNFSS